MPWPAQTQLQNGRYEIEQILGTGGFGITYLAREQMGDRVVIKTLNDRIQKRRDFDQCQQDFLNEALRLAQCRHPHIIRVHQVIQHDALWCIVMDYIDGTNLGAWVEQEGPLPEAEALRYMDQIGDALHAIHQQGFLHRDVKPLNILTPADRDRAILIDFGMAREFTPNLTQVHTEYVSKGFAPIEQYDRRSQRGAYTDVYGLAATLYALLTGNVPVSASVRDRSHAKGEADPLVPPQQANPQISDRTHAAILRGMALLPEDRPQTVTAWLSLLPSEVTSEVTSEAIPEAIPAAIPEAEDPPSRIASAPAESRWHSAVGIDYTRLHDLLERHQWQEADRETEAIVLHVCDRTAAGTVTIEEVQSFPCRDLRTLDRLWVKYSGGRFGWSVQARIWRSTDEDYEAFGDRVGWRSPELWLPYSELTFEIEAPIGHLPSWGRRGRFWPFLAERIEECIEE
jgi:eukaryotic-like serine/threonine-protein kinase